MAQSTRRKIGIDFGESDRQLQSIHAYLATSPSSRETISDALIACLLPAAMFPQGEISSKELWTIGYQSIDRLIAQINSIVDLYSLEGMPLPVDGLARRVSFLGQPSISPLARSIDVDIDEDEGFESIEASSVATPQQNPVVTLPPVTKVKSSNPEPVKYSAVAASNDSREPMTIGSLKVSPSVADFLNGTNGR